MNYVVKAGDTLSKIAAANGITVAQLAAANGIKDANKISVGQTLVIPAKGVTLTSSGQVIPPTTLPKPPATGSSAWDGLAQAITAGVNGHIAIKDAAANRKLAIAQGVPISTVPAEQIATVQTQQEGLSATVKLGLVAAAVAVVGWLVVSESAAPSAPAR